MICNRIICDLFQSRKRVMWSLKIPWVRKDNHFIANDWSLNRNLSSAIASPKYLSWKKQHAPSHRDIKNSFISKNEANKLNIPNSFFAQRQSFSCAVQTWSNPLTWRYRNQIQLFKHMPIVYASSRNFCGFPSDQICI